MSERHANETGSVLSLAGKAVAASATTGAGSTPATESRHLFVRGQEYAHKGGYWCWREEDDEGEDPPRWFACDGMMAGILTALAAARAELENVRRVEAWAQEARRSIGHDAEGWHALELVETDARTVWSSVATADTIAALGAHLEETR